MLSQVLATSPTRRARRKLNQKPASAAASVDSPMPQSVAMRNLSAKRRPWEMSVPTSSRSPPGSVRTAARTGCTARRPGSIVPISNSGQRSVGMPSKGQSVTLPAMRSKLGSASMYTAPMRPQLSMRRLISSVTPAMPLRANFSSRLCSSVSMMRSTSSVIRLSVSR